MATRPDLRVSRPRSGGAGRRALVLAIVVSGCGGADPAPMRPAAKNAVAAADRVCKETQDASRNGPRFPFRDFDPSNPDRRLRAVGRFYRKLDTEGTLTELAGELRELDGAGHVADALERLADATKEQTSAAVAGDRRRMIAATAGVDEALDREHEVAADFGAFACALSLERNPKTLR